MSVPTTIPQNTGYSEDVQEAKTLWNEALNNNGLRHLDPSVQAAWDDPLQEKKYHDLLNKQTVPAEKARLLAVAAEHASDWLNAVPGPALGLKLDDPSLRITCGLRLGSKLCEPHKCVCDT